MSNFDSIRSEIECWKLPAKSAEAVTCVARILHAMETPALLTIRDSIRDSRLRVVITAQGMIWAYFPNYERRWIAQQLPYPVGRGVKVLLVIGEDTIESQPRRATMAQLAHHFGHALCYLRKPGWIHGCPDADRAARKSGLSRFVRARH